jgi:hypothetical protein
MRVLVGEVDHSHPSTYLPSAEIEDKKSHTSCFLVSLRGMYRENFTFTFCNSNNDQLDAKISQVYYLKFMYG